MLVPSKYAACPTGVSWPVRAPPIPWPMRTVQLEFISSNTVTAESSSPSTELPLYMCQSGQAVRQQESVPIIRIPRYTVPVQDGSYSRKKKVSDFLIVLAVVGVVRLGDGGEIKPRLGQIDAVVRRLTRCRRCRLVNNNDGDQESQVDESRPKSDWARPERDGIQHCGRVWLPSSCEISR